MAFSHFLSLLLSYCCLIATSSAYTPLPPLSDAFYQPPAGFQEYPNGAIIRSRSLPTPPAGLNTSVESTYQLLFRTTDSNGLPQAALSTILVPQNASQDSLFSMQNAYDSPAINCAPSYQLYEPDSVIAERQIIDRALEEGWIVSVPDFEGYQSAFTNGVYSGQVVLDSLRAALLSTNVTGISSDANIVLVGGSGGALGSEWALELQESYAPQVKIQGALLVALTPNVTSVLETVDGRKDAPLIPLSIMGLSKFSLEFSKWLAENLVPRNETDDDGGNLFLRASEMCLQEFSDLFGAKNVSSTYFGRPNAFSDPTPQAVLRELGQMGQHGIPRVPIFAYKGTEDEVSPVEDTDELVQMYCDAGARIEYYRAVGVGHPESSILGLEAGWQWVQARMKGEESEVEGCRSRNVFV